MKIKVNVKVFIRIDFLCQKYIQIHPELPNSILSVFSIIVKYIQNVLGRILGIWMYYFYKICIFSENLSF